MTDGPQMRRLIETADSFLNAVPDDERRRFGAKVQVLGLALVRAGERMIVDDPDPFGHLSEEDEMILTGLSRALTLATLETAKAYNADRDKAITEN